MDDRGARRPRRGADGSARDDRRPLRAVVRGGARRRAHAALRRGPGADHRRRRRGGHARAAGPPRRRRRRGQPDADPRALPGGPRDARARGAGQRAPVHGDPRRRRRAAGDRGRRRAAAPGGHCHGCAASASTLELGIKQALQEAAPDLRGDRGRGRDRGHGRRSGRSSCRWCRSTATARAARAEGWLSVPGLEHLGAGRSPTSRSTTSSWWSPTSDGDLLAYRNACAACGAGARGRALEGATLSCPACSHSFELRLAGRSTEGSGLQLAPVPLLREGGDVRVAVAA